MTQIERGIRTPIMHRFVQHRDVIYFGGLVADDTDKGMRGQMEEVCAKLDDLLGRAGSDKSKLLSVTLYVSDLTMKSELNAAWARWLDEAHLPARATVGVADLGPNIFVELVATAAA